MGDTQQLPPTSFFLSQEDSDVDDDIEDLPSFLSEASTKFRQKYLEWHYRSKNENLIAFSNRFFYENRLITFPNPDQNDKSGLDFIHVKEGIYDRGKSRKNMIEAKEVVDTYKKVKKTDTDKSIGIIAFSIAQEKAIREMFQTAGIEIIESIDPNTEELFIKNLETVQGDERDIIIISVGYGKDSNGKLTYNFGPLNRDEGYKRLNVAITRSRYRTIIVSSMLPEDLDEDKLNSSAAKHLKNYLSYARDKNFNMFIESTSLSFESSFEEAVYDALINEKFSVSCQVGCSGYRIDLAIKHPKKLGKYVLGIECDGAQYHSSRYARDRDKIRQMVLESLGWKIHRIWSDDWLKNRENEIKKIRDLADNFLENVTLNENKEQKFSEIEQVQDFKEISLRSKYRKYQVAELPFQRMDLQFDSYGYYVGYQKSLIKSRMMQVIEVESPIEKELLFKRVLDSFGIQKLGSRIEHLFEGLLKELTSDKGIYINQETVALPNTDFTNCIRISTEEQRPFILIPNEEIAAGILDILKNSFTISKDALISDVAKEIYCNNRIGDKITKKIDSALRYLERTKKIEMDKGKIKIIN